MNVYFSETFKFLLEFSSFFRSTLSFIVQRKECPHGMRIFVLPLNRAEHVGYTGRRRYFDLYECEYRFVGSGSQAKLGLRLFDIKKK